MTSGRLLVVSSLVVVGLTPGSRGLQGQSPAASPSIQSLFDAVRENLARAGRLERTYAYKERRTRIHTNPFGKIGTGGTILREVIPLPDGSGFTRRVLERDGKAVQDAETERVQRSVNRRRTSRSPLEDAAAVLEFEVNRREIVGDRPIIVVRFGPKADAEPQTREGRLARAFSGEIWVDEAAQEVMRVEGVAHDSISYGLGLVARLREGTLVSLSREQVDEGVWLPVSMQFRGQGRAMLFRRLDVDFSIEWFDYRRITTADPTTSR